MTHNEAPHIHRFVMTSCNGPCEESLVKTSGVGHFCYICDCGERYKEQAAPTEPLSAEQFAELLDNDMFDQMKAAYADLLTRWEAVTAENTRLIELATKIRTESVTAMREKQQAEQQFREARAEAERLRAHLSPPGECLHCRTSRAEERARKRGEAIAAWAKESRQHVEGRTGTRDYANAGMRLYQLADEWEASRDR